MEFYVSFFLNGNLLAMQGEPSNIQVFCRPNPLTSHKETPVCEETESCLQLVDKKVVLDDPRQERHVNDVFKLKVLHPTISQAEMYEHINKAIYITDVVCGYNNTVIAYGQTGGGKVIY